MLGTGLPVSMYTTKTLIDKCRFNVTQLKEYFTFKEHFIREKYTFLNDFKVRQAICKIRISAQIFQYHKSCFSFLVSRHSMQFPKILIIEKSSLVNLFILLIIF
jgi:hypothetical protein